MMDPNKLNNEAPAEGTGFDELKNVPFAGDKPVKKEGWALETRESKERFAKFPEYLQGICMSEREIFRHAEKDENSYNLFTTHVEYRSKFALNKRTNKNVKGAPGLKEIISEDGFFTPERAELQEYGVQRQYEETVLLSESMRAAERELGVGPTIYALRGISGAGKTTACKKVGFPGMLFDEQGEPSGTLATDNSKTDLYMAGGTSDQIHAESSLMYRKVKGWWMEHVREVRGEASEIHDRVFDEPKDIEELVENAKETGRAIKMLDIDVPYIVSAVRVLTRPKGSLEPHPGSQYLEDTFRSVRVNRQASKGKSAIFAGEVDKETGEVGALSPAEAGGLVAAAAEGVPVDYKLFCYDYNGTPKEMQKLAAEFVTDSATGETRLNVLEPELFYYATDPEETEKEIEKVRKQKITPDFIDWYARTFFEDPRSSHAEKARAALSEYLGRDHEYSIYEALDDKNL